MSYAISQFMCFTSLPTSNNLNHRARSSGDAKRVVANAEPITRVGQADVLRICWTLFLFCFRPALIVGINRLPEMIERGRADMPIAWSRRKCLAPRTAPPSVLVKTGAKNTLP